MRDGADWFGTTGEVADVSGAGGKIVATDGAEFARVEARLGPHPPPFSIFTEKGAQP